MDNHDNEFSIVGAGRAGCALACALKSIGFHLSGVFSRSPEGSQSLINRLEQGRLFQSVNELRDGGNWIFLTVPDRIIVTLSREILPLLGNQQRMVHCSGVYPADIMRANGGRRRISLASFHPLISLPKCCDDPTFFKDVTIGIEGEEQIVVELVKISYRMGAIPIVLDHDKKSLYHAAACIASNYLPAIYMMSVRLFMKSRIVERTASECTLSLMRGVIKNIESYGPEVAMTGPMIRGDTETLQEHLEALRLLDPELKPHYLNLNSLLRDFLPE